MKKALSFLLAASMLVGLTACGGGNGGGGSNGKKDANALTIVFRDDGIGEKGAAWQWMKNSSETWDGMKINIAPIKASEGEYFAKIALQLKSSSTAPDIVTEDTFQLANDVSAGYLTDLSEYVKDYDLWNDGSYYDSMKEGISLDGKPYAIPYNTDTRGLWYNKDIFKKSGLEAEWAPKNWEEIFSALKTIKDKNPDIVPFWCNSGVATGEATSMQTYEMLLYAAGGRLMDDAGKKWVVESGEIITALQFIEKIYKEELGPPLSKVLNGQASNTSSREYLPEGKLAVSLDGSWITGNYLDSGASPWKEYGETLGFAAFPTDKGQEPGTMTLAGGWGLAIPEKSTHKDEAFDFIVHCMDAKNYTKAVIAMGSLTSRKDVAESEEYSSIPFKQLSTDFLQTAEFRPKNDKYSSVSTCIQNMVESVASGTMTPQKAMEKYAVDVARTVGDDNVVKK